MTNFKDLKRPDLSDLSGFGDVTGNGFQGAHVHGKARLAPDLKWLFKHMNSGLPIAEHLDVNEPPPLKWSTPIVRKPEDHRWLSSAPNLKILL
ncbi:hypothetical protein PsAD37_01748 [Pseudovibrio sp. Ad37]|nr:hypothetical protein PsAD37_01748 [Pseudovibrio sp. Ad37]